MTLAAVALVFFSPGDWPNLRPAQRWLITANALLIEAALLALAMPVVVIVRREWLKPALVMIAVSGALFGALAAQSPGAVSRMAQGHAALGAIAITAAGLGACAAAWWANELDAAAVTVLTALALIFGAFLAGPAMTEAPTAYINALLAANPVVATAAAADIDLLRSDPFYRLSPIAHGSFDYPSWRATVTAYLAVGAGAWILAVVFGRRRVSS